MTEIADQEDHLDACHSTGSTPTPASSQLTRPKSRLKSWLKTIETAATDVAIGRMTLSRKKVRPRRRRLSKLAPTSARVSCGTVESRKIATVLPSAFQKTGSVSSRA